MTVRVNDHAAVQGGALVDDVVVALNLARPAAAARNDAATPLGEVGVAVPAGSSTAGFVDTGVDHLAAGHVEISCSWTVSPRATVTVRPESASVNTTVVGPVGVVVVGPFGVVVVGPLGVVVVGPFGVVVVGETGVDVGGEVGTDVALVGGVSQVVGEAPLEPPAGATGPPQLVPPEWVAVVGDPGVTLARPVAAHGVKQ